jgi:UDP-GlcNAc3NAcA epimerase
MIALESNCKLIITDSGGVQKEAYYFNKPSIILRSETEWVEIVKVGAAIIANADEDKILQSYDELKNNSTISFPSIFGDGKAAEFICSIMLST